MLTIRLQRVGKAKFPTYRVIVSEKARDTQYNYLENLGTYNPHIKENQLVAKADRIKYWIEKGAQTSDTVHNLLVSANIIEGKKKKSVFLSKARQAKIAEKKKSSAPAVALATAPVQESAPASEPAPQA
ncbi:30S ribosomal protein S16 [Patescibacteria group bacterium]|nr:30S ribosomal protein S16 [Patescibacteria group bacterium]MBU1613006.1 30S ribosomal protein S16 [Patescibacteria group bacterium]